MINLFNFVLNFLFDADEEILELALYDFFDFVLIRVEGFTCGMIIS